MVSQSAGRQDSPMDPWEGISNDPGDIDGSPGLLDTDHPSCASNIRFTRHRAAWINPQCVQQQVQDSPPQVPAVGSRESHTARDAASPLGPSPLPLGDSVAETSLSKGTVDSMGSSPARGSAEKGSASSLTSKEEWAVLPGRCPWTALFTSSKIDLAARPCREADNAFFKPSQLTASTDAGCAVLQVSPVVETPTHCDVMKEDCKCDLDEFVIVELGDFSNATETCGCSCSSSKRYHLHTGPRAITSEALWTPGL
ncbi:hypothetical protein ESR_24280, partial [Eschrichtius robustus]|nr:hypothetical protein [Eschrichtius robustus]